MTLARTATVQSVLENPGTGRPMPGKKVSIRLNVDTAYTNSGATEKIRTTYATTNSAGLWSVVLEINDDIDPTGTWYTVQAPSGVGSVQSFQLTAAQAGQTVNLRDVLISSPANTVPIQAGASAAALTAATTTSRQVSLARWDDFNRPDGRLDASNGGLLPSGQKWNLAFSTSAGSTGVASDLLIVNKRLRFDKPGASYLWTTGPSGDTSQSIAGHAVEFSFDPGSTFAAAVTICCSQKQTSTGTGTTGVATNSVHLTVSPTGWSVGIFDGTTLLSIMANGTFTTPLVCDGATRYRVAINRTDVDRIEIELPTPDGTAQVTRTVQDARIPSYWGSTSLIEHYNPPASFATDARPIITGYGVKGPWTSLAAQFAGYASKSANLSDLPSAATARTNLGLTAPATAPFGTTTGTVADGGVVATNTANIATNTTAITTAQATARAAIGLAVVLGA